VVPEDNHKRPQGGSFEIPRGTGGGVFSTKILMESMKLNWNFQKGVGIQIKKPSVGGSMDIFWNNAINTN